MKLIDDAELSGLLDGELTAERAREVRDAMAQSAALRRRYEELAAMDAEFRTQAQAAAFRPQVVLMAQPFALGAGLCVATVALLLFRVALKILPPAAGIPLEVVLLAALLLWGVPRLLRLGALGYHVDAAPA